MVKHSNPQVHHLNYYKPWTLFEIWNSSCKCYLQNYLKLVILFQTIQLIAQRPIASIYEKKPKLFTNKSPWGIKTYGKHVLWLFCRMHTTWPKRTSPVQKTLEEGKELRVDNQPLFITNQKEQLKTYTREPSPCEWTKGCPINFLPLSTWRE